jgi:small-conductance mechanosensitive channel
VSGRVEPGGRTGLNQGLGGTCPGPSDLARRLRIELVGALFALSLVPVAAAPGGGAPDLERHHKEGLLAASENATAELAVRFRQIAAAANDLAAVPAMFWRWLTQDGGDPWAPLRSLAVALVLILLGWMAQAVAGRAMTKAARRWTRSSSRFAEYAGPATIAARWLAFLAVVAVAHALVPEISRASRLTALALILTFAGSWIGSRAFAHVLARSDGTSAASMPLRLLQAALAIFLAALFVLVLLREAGISDDARLILGIACWLPFGALLLLAVQSAREPAAANDATGLAADGIERFINRHGPGLARFVLMAVVVATPVVALIRGPTAFWDGAASLALIVLTAVLLGPTPASSSMRRKSESPWAWTLRRALRLLTLSGFALALAAVWDPDLFRRMNTHLGENAVRGAVTVAITALVAYLTWDVIRTGLAQSLLRPLPTGVEGGQESGALAATRLQTIAPVLRNFLFVAVITVATLVCLAMIGVNITPLLAGAGVVGIALGFGAQTLVRDVISGVFFLAEDAFRIGEYISIGNTRGTVEGIAIRSLKLRHHRGPVHTVPFGEIKQLTNYSRDWIIMKVELLLAFDTDLRKVKRIVKEIGEQLQADPELGHAVLQTVKSQGVRRLEPGGMVVGLKFMARPGSEVYMLRREIYHRVRDAFEENGIHFARNEVLIASPADAAPAGAARVGASADGEQRATGT